MTADDAVPARRARWPLRLARRWMVRSPHRLALHTTQFSVREPWKRQRIAEIAFAFVTGYNAMVQAERPLQIRPTIDALPPYYRPFAYEGAAMGFGAWAVLHGRNYATFEATIHSVSPQTLYQNYVGLGWWLDLWARRPYRIADAIRGFDHRYREIAYEGLGFRRGFLHPRRLEAARRFQRFGVDACHVCYQGFGRSFWFVDMDDLPRAYAAIDRVPAAFLGDCYSDIGLGVAYSMIDRIELFYEVLRSIDPRDRPDFLQGAAFGWEARQLANRTYFDEQLDSVSPTTRRHINKAVEMVHHAQRVLEDPGAPTGFISAGGRSPEACSVVPACSRWGFVACRADDHEVPQFDKHPTCPQP